MNSLLICRKTSIPYSTLLNPELQLRGYHHGRQGLKVKVKSSMARSFPVEYLLPQNVGSIINYLQQFTEVAQLGAPMQSTTTSYGQWRQRQYIQLTGRTHHPTQGSTHWAPRLHTAMRAANQKTYCTQWAANVRPSECQANVLPVLQLRV